MTPSQRSEFLHNRSKGLGGSDAASLLALPEARYSCRRRLWYDKSRVEPDFPREETGPLRLGVILEPVLCDEFAKLTGRRIESVGQQKHPDFPELVGHVDRMQYDPAKDGPGVLECKALGTRIFYETKRAGLAPEYLCQLQWYLLVTDSSWGSFVIGNRDNLAILHFDMERNEDICEAMVRAAGEFWPTVGHEELIPGRLEPDSFACQRCEYRIRCQGSTLLPPDTSGDDIPIAPDLAGLAQEIVERQGMFDEAEELLAESKEILKLLLGDQQAVRVPLNGQLRNIYYRQQAGKPLYADAVKNMSVQYNQLRERLVQIEKTGDAALAKGAELVPPPSSFVKTGKPSRPLMTQYLNPKPKKEE